MTQIIEQSDKFGKIGKAFGEGLGEQLPKEVERKRLSQGLQQFEQQSGNLTPMQSLARLSSIPGITPQMIQSFGDLAKQQGMRNAYTQPGGVNRGSIGTTGTQANMPAQLENIIQKQAANLPQRTSSNVPAEARGQPQIVDRNPLRPEAIPKAPWTSQKRDQNMAETLQRFPHMSTQEAQQIVADNEARDLAQPEAQQKIDTYLQSKKEEANNSFTSQLETKLQKSGEGVFRDITGENLNNLRRGMERDLAINPNATEEDVANTWSNKALHLAKTKSEIKTATKKLGLDTIFKGDETRRNIEAQQKVFADANNEEEFYNILRTSPISGNPDSYGYSLSPQVAASYAYPRSKGVSNYISSVQKSTLPFKAENYDRTARQHAARIEGQLTDKDSLLAIAYDLKKKEPFFDPTAFFDQILQDADRIGLTDLQKRELTTTRSDFLPTWGDVFIGGKK